MFVLDLKINKDVFPELISRLEKLDTQRVDIGIFKEQGFHSRSEYRYSDMLSYFARGNASQNLVPRPVMYKAITHYPISTSSLKKDLKKYFRHLGKKKTYQDAEKIMQNLGVYYRGKARSIMGNETMIAPNTEWTKLYKESRGFDATKPLIQYGELASKLALKVNGGIPVEIGY